MSGDWKTSAEWAKLSLIGLAETRQGIETKAKRENWRDLGPEKARKRKGRGGGWEYHISCLPEAAQAEYYRRVDVVQAETKIAKRARTDLKVATKKATQLNAPCRRAMESRAAVLREIDRRSFMDGLSRRKSILSFLHDVSWDLECVKSGRIDQCVLTPALLKCACDANDRGKSRIDGSRKGPSRTQIYNWFKTYEAKGVTALAPEVTRQKQGEPQWLGAMTDFG